MEYYLFPVVCVLQPMEVHQQIHLLAIALAIQQ